MICSICIATYDKPDYLARTLSSIVRQRPPFPWELIVVDDGSPTDETRELCSSFSRVTYLRRWRQAGYTNPGYARNMAYRYAKGEILICQSDDVVHGGPDTIEQLVNEMHPLASEFVIANVINSDTQLQPTPCMHPRNPNLVELTGPKGKRPLFFLGAVYRKNVYEVGGNDERFTTPGKEDIYFVDCLVKGLGLKPYFSSVRAYHLHHDRPPLEILEPSERVYDRLVAEGTWRARGAPWSYNTSETPKNRTP